MTNTCADCAHVHTTTKAHTPYRWRCLRSPHPLQPPPGLELVAPEWRPDAPYTLCVNVRAAVGEACPEFEPRKTPGHD